MAENDVLQATASSQNVGDYLLRIEKRWFYHQCYPPSQSPSRESSAAGTGDQGNGGPGPVCYAGSANGSDAADGCGVNAKAYRAEGGRGGRIE